MFNDDDDDFLSNLDAFTSPSLESTIQSVYSALNLAQPPSSMNSEQPPDAPMPATALGVSTSSSSPTVSAITTRNSRKRKRGAAVDPSPLPPPPSVVSTWTCQLCTLINSVDLSECAACGFHCVNTSVENGTVPSPPSLSSSSSGVICPQCSFLNPVGSAACEMCDWGVASIPPVHVREGAVRGATAASSPPSEVSLHGMERHDSPSTVEELSEEEETDIDSDSEDDALSVSDEDSNVEDVGGNVNFVQFLQHLEVCTAEDLPMAEVPSSMAEHGELLPYQLQALHWLRQRESVQCTSSSLSVSPAIRRNTVMDAEIQDLEHRSLSRVHGGIFADYMGLGKTRTLISLCESTRSNTEKIKRSNIFGSEVGSPATLIVVPPSLIGQWVAEIRQCVHPAPRILHYYGEKRRRMSFIQIAENYDYVLVSYQTLMFEAFKTQNASFLGPFRSSPALPFAQVNGKGNEAARPPLGHLFMIHWHRIILDEAHYIRNMHSKTSRSCCLLTGSARWVVTATPIQNRLNDVYPLLKFLKVPLFGNLKWWNSEIVDYFKQDTLHSRPTIALRMLFASLSLRRTPETKIQGVPLLQLPPLRVETERVPLSSETRQFYDAVHHQANDKLESINQSSATGGSRQRRLFQTGFEMLIRCRQACLHPYIVVATLQHLGYQWNSQHSAANETERSERRMNEIQNFIDKKVMAFIGRAQQGSSGWGVSEFVLELIEALRQQQLQDRECLICLDSMLSPAILPCGHTFCHPCISHVLDELAPRCPLCKARVTHRTVLPVPVDLLKQQSDAPKKDDKCKLNETEIFMRATELGAQLQDCQKWPVMYSEKTEALLRHLRAIPEGEKCIVFSSFVTYLKFLKCYLDNNTNMVSELFSGSLTLSRKHQVLRRFSATTPVNEKPVVTVLLASITSCGVGLNLVSANHGFIMDPSYNPGVEIQAIHRLHRIGQTKPVRIVKFFTRDTVDENIEELRQRKASLNSHCFEAAHSTASAGGAQRLTASELFALFGRSTDEEKSEDKC